MKLYARWHERRWEFDVERDGEHIVVAVGKEKVRLRFDELRAQYRSFLIDSRKVDFGWMRDGERYQIVLQGIPYDITVKDSRSEKIESMKRATSAHSGALEIRAPIPGMIAKILVQAGAAVKKDQPLLTLNAMKMENEIASPRDGKVEEILVQPGKTVDRDDLLVILGE